MTNVSSRVGRTEIGGDPEPVSNIEIYVGLKPPAQWTTEVAIASGPPQIRRNDARRRMDIEATMAGRDMGSVVAEIDRRIAAEVDLPPGYTVVLGGQFENQQRARHRPMVVVPLSLGLIFLLL